MPSDDEAARLMGKWLQKALSDPIKHWKDHNLPEVLHPPLSMVDGRRGGRGKALFVTKRVHEATTRT